MLTSIKSKVFKLMSEQFGIDVNDIKSENHIIDDLNADSVDIVELVIALEEEFKIAIEMEEPINAITVQLTIDLVTEKLSKPLG